MKKIYLIPLFFLTVISLLSFPNVNAQAPNLGSAGNFVLFTTAGAVGSTGTTKVVGNVGSNEGDITGFDTVLNNVYTADIVTVQCLADLLIAYTQLNITVATIFPSSLLGNGQVLYPGVHYISEAATLNSGLTFNALGNADAVFIIKIQGAFSANASSKVYLVNGALARNIYWKVEGAVEMAAGTYMRGTIIANNGAISMGANDTLEGRALSTTGAISVYESVAYTPNFVLPVTLLDFKATHVNHNIELLWTTANEVSFEKYDLERSADGHNFYTIGSVQAGNTHYMKTYTWRDTEPIAGVNFYRLKMINIDGVFKYSIVIKINTTTKKSISIYPNPVTGGILMLQMYGQLKGNHNTELYTMNGEKVMSSVITCDGNDAVRSINLNKNLLRGVYYLEISDPERNKTAYKIFIN